MFANYSRQSKKMQEIVALHQKVYGTPEGQKLLEFQLTELGYFDTGNSDEYHKALRDYSIRILDLCGIYDPRNVEKFVSQIWKIKLPPNSYRPK